MSAPLRPRTRENARDDEHAPSPDGDATLVTGEWLAWSLFESSPDCLFIADLDGRVLEINRAGLTLLELDDEELARGLPWGGALGIDDVARCAEMVASGCDGHSTHLTARGATAIETAKWWDVSVSPIHGRAGDVQRLLVIARDATDAKRAESALRESDRRHRLLFDASPVPMWIYDPTSLHVLSVNDAAVASYGYTRDEFLSMSVAQLRPPEDAARIFSGPWIRDDAPVLGLYRHRRKDGSEFMADVASHAFMWEGQLARLVQATDATDRLNAEALVRSSESRLRTVVDALHEGVILLDEHGMPILWNQAAERILGCSGNELATRTAATLFPHAIREDHTSLPAGEHPALTTLRTGQSRVGVSLGVVRPNGALVWLNVDTEPVARCEAADGAHVETAIVVTFADVTQSREADRERARLAAIVESSDNAIVSTSRDGMIRTWNGGAERLFGYAAREIVGRSILELVLPDRWTSKRGMLKCAADGEHVAQQESLHVRRDGSRVPVSVNVSPMRDPSGHVGGVSWVMQDVSAQHELETHLRQAQKMEALGRLAGGVAHDFNNVLTAIRANAEFAILDEPQNPALRGEIDEILRATDRAAALTRQLLAFSRRQVLTPRALDINEVVERVAKMLVRIIGEDVRLETVLDASPAHIVADVGQLEQALVNLAVNARDAMPDGGTLTIRTSASVGEIGMSTLRAARLATAAGVVLVSVTDTGVGMDASTQARAFEPFFTTKAEGKGTGLGLATVHGIAEQSGGSVWIESAPGAGTTVWLALPLALDSIASRPSRMLTPIVSAPAVRGAGSILLVEDEDAIRGVAERMLERLGYRVLSAANGREARERWNDAGGCNGNIAVVLSDVVMPEEGGPALVRALREDCPDLPVVYMSGYVDGRLAAADLEGRTAFLAKPFGVEELTTRLQEVLAPVGA